MADILLISLCVIEQYHGIKKKVAKTSRTSVGVLQSTKYFATYQNMPIYAN